MTVDTQIEFDKILKATRDCLADLLVTELGIYEILNGSQIVGETPSIRVGNSTNTKKIRLKPNSGIECVISFPEFTYIPIFGAESKELTYCISLVQYDTTKSTSVAVNQIMSEQTFRIVKTEKSPYQYFGDSYKYESCKLYFNLFYRL